MNKLLVVVLFVVSLSACTKEDRTCGRMESLCGTSKQDCKERLDAVKEVAGQEGVDAVAKCFAEASTCSEASGCTAGMALKGAEKAAGEFLEGMKKALDKK